MTLLDIEKSLNDVDGIDGKLELLNGFQTSEYSELFKMSTLAFLTVVLGSVNYSIFVYPKYGFEVSYGFFLRLFEIAAFNNDTVLCINISLVFLSIAVVFLAFFQTIDSASVLDYISKRKLEFLMKKNSKNEISV